MFEYHGVTYQNGWTWYYFNPFDFRKLFAILCMRLLYKKDNIKIRFLYNKNSFRSIRIISVRCVASVFVLEEATVAFEVSLTIKFW